MKRFLATAPISAVILIGSWMSSAAFAQQTTSSSPLHGNVHDRGVKILQAETPPPPAAVTPAPVATGTTATPAIAPPVAATVQQGAASPPASVINACARPIAQPDLQVDASVDFKGRLSSHLVGGKRVVLDLTTPYGADQAAPAGLAPWLNAVKASGGQVTVAQYCLASRGFGTWFKTLFGPAPAADAAMPRSYRSARNYDVVLHADALDQKITQVEFVPRNVRTSS